VKTIFGKKENLELTVQGIRFYFK